MHDDLRPSASDTIPPGRGAAATRCPVLILNYGGWADTISGLGTMRAYLPDLWLIDNRSPDDRTGEVRALFPDVRIVAMEENWGWAGAYNRAIRMARDEGFPAVYILNNDAVARPGAVEAALASLVSAPRIAAVGSVMLDHGGTRIFFDGDWYFGASQPGLRAATAARLRDVRSIHGGGFALNMAAFDEVGPFHEDYFLYHEETDWCLRAMKAGWRIVVDSESCVDHDGKGSNTGFNSSYYMARNRFLAFARGIPLRDTPESRGAIVEYEYLESARRSLSERVAITNGLIDGLLGRFGKRVRIWPSPLTVPLAATLPLLFRLKRAIRHRMGRSGGKG